MNENQDLNNKSDLSIFKTYMGIKNRCQAFFKFFFRAGWSIDGQGDFNQRIGIIKNENNFYNFYNT